MSKSLDEMIERLRAAFADVPEDELEREIDAAISQVHADEAREREALPSSEHQEQGAS